MPSSSYATSVIQIGLETTYGVLVPANKKLNDLRIDPTPQFETDAFLSSGDTATSLVVVNDEFTEADVTGRLSFTGTMYPLASMFGAPVTTTPAGGTLARQHVYSWDGRTPLAAKSFSLDYGRPGAGNARTIAGFLFNAMNYSVARTGLDFGASGFGKPVTTGATLTATPTDIPAQPVFPTHFSLWGDDTWAGLGTTQLLDTYTIDTDIGERTARTRPVNRAGTSDGTIEAEDQEHTMTFQMAADAVGDGFFTNIHNGTMKFFRLEAIGPQIETGTPNQFYMFRQDTAILFQGNDGYSSLDGVHGITWVGRISRDPVAALAARWTIVNKQTSL